MLQTIVLICAAAVSRDACTMDNAIDVVRFPPERAAMCGPAPLMALARTAIAPEPGKSYAKIICTRRSAPERGDPSPRAGGGPLPAAGDRG